MAGKMHTGRHTVKYFLSTKCYFQFYKKEA
jgi:hypothetical protein